MPTADPEAELRLWTPPPSSADRAVASAKALADSTAQHGRGATRTRAGRRLVVQAEPRLAVNQRGLVVGVAVQVRMYNADTGTELPIDPDRIIGRPPQEHQGAHDPLAALWDALWGSVLLHPNPAGWRPATGR